MPDDTIQPLEPIAKVIEELHPVHGVLDRLAQLASTFGSHAETEIKKLIAEARKYL